MKTRESDMPDEAVWAGFFQPEVVLIKLGLAESCETVADFGCGYGTFTIPAATIACGIVHAFDIEPAMVETTQRKAEEAKLANVRAVCCDFATNGTGLDGRSVDYAMLFNILHAQERAALMCEAHRILRPDGLLAIMHWNHDPNTPRGPSMLIRPRPEDLRECGQAIGFVVTTSEPIALPPHHYGWMMRKAE